LNDNRLNMDADDLPLTGVRVVDFTNGLAGPLAAMVLADLGADIVKVEMTGRGDLTRDLSPAMFTIANRNKRSIAVDLKDARGAAIAHRLIERADVLVESFRPEIMDRLGLGAATVFAVNPRLIYASISGFGRNGPNRERRAVDAVAQAEAGMIAANEGIEAPFTIVDTTTGLVLAQAVLAALVRRGRTGRGGVIEAPLVATALQLQAVQLADFARTGITLTPRERARRAPTAAIFPAADGPVYVAAHYEEHWRMLAETLGAPELIDDPRFATREARVDNGAALRACLEERFATRTRAEWFALLDARGLMVAPVRGHSEVLADDELRSQGWITDVDGTPLVALGYAFDDEVPPVRAPAPELGADTSEVLAEIGYGAAEINALREAAVVDGA
jgi:crotonobetainyl-CoA:carnitine CoA-transferase CaiB-like acyl-CoA transferase